MKLVAAAWRGARMFADIPPALRRLKDAGIQARPRGPAACYILYMQIHSHPIQVAPPPRSPATPRRHAAGHRTAGPRL